MFYWFLCASSFKFNTQVKKNLNPLCTVASMIRITLQFEIFWTRLIFWIMIEIALFRLMRITLAIVFLFFFYYLISIPLRCNHAALALVSVAKEKEEVIIWLEECHSFFFSIIQHYFCINNKVYYRFC